MNVPGSDMPVIWGCVSRCPDLLFSSWSLSSILTDHIRANLEDKEGMCPIYLVGLDAYHALVEGVYHYLGMIIPRKFPFYG